MEHLTRRHVLLGVATTVAALAAARPLSGQAPPTSAGPADPGLI